MQIHENVDLAPLTTFQIEGKARYFVEAKNEFEVRDALGWAREKNVPFFILAGGSNVLVPHMLDGLVIRVASTNFSFTDQSLIADAGCTLLDLIRASAEEGLGGWEKLAGIPGTLGGAIRGNAGAFGPEIKDFVTWVRAINTKTEDVHEFSHDECHFDYRMSYFKKHPEWIILNAHLKLLPVQTTEAQETIAATIAEREKRHIQNVRAAGSYFMNPVAPPHIVALFEEEKGVKSRGNRVPAGWLIEKAGMKGMSLGGAQSSPQQANYLINAGGATAEEVRELATKIKEEVYRQFGVTLEEEAVVF